MTKRKRDDTDEGEHEGEVDLRAQGRFQVRYSKSVGELTAALKIARGFERQKMGRRQKQASGTPQTLLRLREEVILLKQLDLEKTAKNYLLKYLTKIKRIREHPIFISCFGAQPKIEAVKPGAEANVLARLCKSAPVKEAIDKIVDATYKILGLQSTSMGAGENGKLTGRQSYQRTVRSTSTSVSDDSSVTEVSLAERPRELIPKDAMGVDGDDDFASFSSGSISRSVSPAADFQHDPNAAFLPSLGMTGYYSGSESDDDDDGGPAEPKVRKNRRGQRARQQLAEMKYGKSAKHLQKPRSDPGRNAGWDGKRGAVGNPNGERLGHNRLLNSSQPASSGRRNDREEDSRAKPKTRDDTGPLHPSWQAAKQRKGQASVQAAFTGKKVTFD